MTDLLEVLPDFDLRPFLHLTHSLEKNRITVADLVSGEPIEIARRCPLPLADLRSMVQAVVKALQHDLSKTIASQTGIPSIFGVSHLETDGEHAESHSSPSSGVQMVKTLDTTFDHCLGGGFPVGHITEIVGESAVGKTQYALSLLLSVQLPTPQGLGKSAIYLSTEAPLNTTRLHQILLSHPIYQALDATQRPSLDRVHAISTNDLEGQEHIVSYQLPLAVERYDVGLIVMDSVAANFRAEHETRTAKGLADRAGNLTKLGTMLRKIARESNVAVVVTNQVSDRFDDARGLSDRVRTSSPAHNSSPAVNHPPSTPTAGGLKNQRLSLDHQQLFFTGWGDSSASVREQPKTPALGLAWANQISARVVLKLESERQAEYPPGYTGGNIWKDKKKRRFLGVVFAPWTPPTSKLVEYEIQAQGPVSLPDRADRAGGDGEHADLLDPKLWFDGNADEEDYV